MQANAIALGRLPLDCGRDSTGRARTGECAHEGAVVVPKCTTVVHFLVALRGLWLALLSVWRDPETKALPLIVGVLLLP